MALNLKLFLLPSAEKKAPLRSAFFSADGSGKADNDKDIKIKLIVQLFKELFETINIMSFGTKKGT